MRRARTRPAASKARAQPRARLIFMDGAKPLRVTHDGAIATLVLDRPRALNTLDFAMMDALVDAIGAVSRSDARVLVITGAGPHFMAGGDLRAFAAALERPMSERAAFFRPLIA